MGLFVYATDEVPDDTVREIAGRQAATGKHFVWSLSPDDFCSLLWALQACYGGDNRPLHDGNQDADIQKWARDTITKFAKKFGEYEVTEIEREVGHEKVVEIDYAATHTSGAA